MAHRSRDVLSQRLGRSRARSSFPWAVASGVARWRRQSDRSKPNTRGSRPRPCCNESRPMELFSTSSIESVGCRWLWKRRCRRSSSVRVPDSWEAGIRRLRPAS